MLRIKSTPLHNFEVDIKLYSEIDPEYMIGRIDEEGKVIENEIEVELDGKPAMIKLLGCFKKEFKALPVMDFILRLAKGLDGKQVQQVLKKKYGAKIGPDTIILIYQYQILEIGE